MKRTHATLKRKIKGWVKEAQNKMLLHTWTLEVRFNLTSQNSGDGEGGPTTMMNFSGLPEYMNGTICVNIEAISKCPEEEIRLFCYHEVAHAFTLEFATLAGARYLSEQQLAAAQEKFVQTLAKILAS